MKLKHTLSLASLAVCAALSTSAAAQTVVNFEGFVVDEACTITAGANNLVTLPVVPLSALNAPNANTGHTEFTVTLKDCTKGAGNYQVEFSDPSAVNGRLPNQAAGGAQDVSLVLISSANEWLTVDRWPTGTRVAAAIDPGITVDATGNGSGIYKVAYVADSASATAGKVEAKATMTTNFL